MEQVTELNNSNIPDLLKKIFLPLIIFIGLVGNTISIMVFSRKSLKNHTTFRYLLLISVIDICVLLTCSGDMLLQVYFNLNIRLLNDFFCKTHSFLVIFFTHSSSMLLACMSIDRALAITIKIDSKKSKIQTVNRVFLILLILIGLLNLHFLIFTDIIYFENESSSINSTNSTNNTMYDNMKFCYARADSFYFNYLKYIFPW